jgi:membrane-associated phospholipid phosphatase
VPSPVRPVAAALLLVLAPAGRSEEPDRFASQQASDLAITGASLAITGATVLWQPRLEPERCRWCAPGSLDAGARRILVLPEGARSGAGAASDVIVVALVPAVVAQRLWAAGDRRSAEQDLLLVTEAASLALATTQVTKLLAARERPFVHYGSPDRPHASGDDLSFWSGHTAFAFALATSAGTLSSMRQEPSAPWVWGVGMTLAAAVGTLRVASDQHYLSDVLAGAAVGAAFGVLVPRLRFGREREAGAVVVAPFGRGLMVSVAF